MPSETLPSPSMPEQVCKERHMLRTYQEMREATERRVKEASELQNEIETLRAEAGAIEKQGRMGREQVNQSGRG